MRKMPSILRLFSVFSLLTVNINAVQALESDQFMTWEKNLPNIEDALNQHVNQTVREALAELAQKNTKISCTDAGYFAIKKFRGFFIHKIETWLADTQGENLYPTASTSAPNYFQNSIYNFRYSTIARLFPMGRNMNINGVIIGADKLGHFFSTGLRYFNMYNNLIDKGLSESEATNKAINFGITLEKSYLGLWPAGVFSFGDLEANYQGLQMNLSFCQGERPFLAQAENGSWILKHEIELKNFINPYMDETFNLSYFGFLKWLKVKPMLKKYCKKMGQPAVTERIEYYNSIAKKSYNIQYLEELEAKNDGTLPDRKTRSFQDACSDK